jgi:hypothetical protein
MRVPKQLMCLGLVNEHAYQSIAVGVLKVCQSPLDQRLRNRQCFNRVRKPDQLDSQACPGIENGAVRRIADRQASG